MQTRDGKRYRLASAEAPEEQASLEAFCGSIQSRLGRAPRADSPAPEVALYRCTQCAVALLPTVESVTLCAHCGAENPVPPALQERARAHHKLLTARQRSGELVTRLLEQPGAAWADRVLLLLACGSLLVWSLLISGLQIASFSNMGAFELFWSLTAGTGLVLVFFTWSRAALVKRPALNLLCAHFGARQTSEGGSPCCRNCGGPLPDSDWALVSCLFCDSENVLGIDLRPFQKPLEDQTRGLTEVLQEREKEERRWRGSSIAVLAVAAVAGFMGLAQYSVASEFADELARCEAGEVEACYSVAVEYDLGIAVSEDSVEALRYYLWPASKITPRPAIRHR